MTVVKIQREVKNFPATKATDFQQDSGGFDKKFRLHGTQGIYEDVNVPKFRC